MHIEPVTSDQADDYIIDLTKFQRAAGLGIPLTRHQVTLEFSGISTELPVTLSVKPVGAALFESVNEGTANVAGDAQVTFVIRDIILDAIKVNTGVLASNTYTVRYSGTGDYNEM